MKIFKRALITIFIFLLLVISPYFVSSIRNDMTLNNFSKQLFNIDLPDTSVVDTFSTCGKLNGNGNGMDFLACVLVDTTLSYDELVKQVENVPFVQAKEGAAMQYFGIKEKGPIDIEIKSVTEVALKTQYLEHGKMTFDALKGNIDDKNLFFIAIYDGGYSADFDLRGH